MALCSCKCQRWRSAKGPTLSLPKPQHRSCNCRLQRSISFQPQDTDSVGLGSGAYASRQTYIGTAAIYNTGQLLIERILAHAAQMSKKAVETLRYQNGFVRNRQGNALYSIRDIALHSYYDLQQANVICAEKTTQLKTNALSLGCCFAEVEVDIATGQVTVVDILNVHDCGRVVNPVLAQVQVYGGISMGLGWALAEQMQFDKKTGRLHQDNLLDYKLPTAMDHPSKIRASFIENPEADKSLRCESSGRTADCSRRSGDSKRDSACDRRRF